MSQTRRMVLNFVLFQVGWLACVVGGATQWHWAGPVFVAVVLAFHLTQSSRWSQEIILVLFALIIGTLWDSLLVATDLLQYHHGLFHPEVAPYWIIAMWALFATTLNVSMRWLRGRWLIAGLFGAIGGPLAYYAGTRLGAVTMPDQSQALLALTIGWAVIMPVLMWIAERFDGFATPQPTLTETPL